MKIGIASDHRGYDLKNKLIKELNEYEMIDFGTDTSASVDYPDYAFLLGEAVRDQKIDFGIAICGSGIGISIACNKVKKVRCAHVSTEAEAEMTRKDNNANIISLSAKTSLEDAKNIIRVFLTTKFSNIERHQRRIDKIMRYENER